MRMLFICVLYYSAGCFNGHAAKVVSGPYKMTVLRAEKCKQTSYPMDPDPPMKIHLEVYNTTKKTSLMRGNLNVSKENKQIKLKMKRYLWQDDQWKLMFAMDNIGCHGVLLHTMMMALGLKYNREDCSFPKGNYTFQDLDVDCLQHIWKSEMEYGRVLRVSETTRGYITYDCWEFESLVSPI